MPGTYHGNMAKLGVGVSVCADPLRPTYLGDINIHSPRQGAAAASISLLLDGHVSQTPLFQSMSQRLSMNMSTVYIPSCK